MPVADVAVGRDPRSSRRATVHVPASQKQQLVRQSRTLHNAPARAIQVIRQLRNTSSNKMLIDPFKKKRRMPRHRQFVVKLNRRRSGNVPASFPRVGTNTARPHPVSTMVPDKDCAQIAVNTAKE